MGPTYTPDVILDDLFVAVQSSGIFDDSKSFADAIPNRQASDILADYHRNKNNADFDLKSFINTNFEIPTENNVVITGKSDIINHIESLWDKLTRIDHFKNGSGSILPLPYPYIVPGGRFREIYYWDSYFTMLGLARSDKWDMVRNMVKNFEHLIHTFGHIPNGNRTYYLSRSQPPFFALMVEFLAGYEGEEKVYTEFIEGLETEYNYWMYGHKSVSNNFGPRLIVLQNDKVLNRYWDDNPVPRQESYVEDLHLARDAGVNPEYLFRNIRAACESGWDFSSRWFKNDSDLRTINTTDILPLDLNALLYKLEKVLQKAWKFKADNERSMHFEKSASKRKSTFREYFWNEEKGFYFDYNFNTKRHQSIYSLAACCPLWMKFAEDSQAQKIAETLERDFLKPGGLVTSTIYSGQQWDAPNGWAPLQWIAVKGLENYGYHKLAKKVRESWITIVENVFRNTGKIMEKYNVEDLSLKAGGGEYPVQDGFGWTNGVFLDFWYNYHIGK